MYLWIKEIQLVETIDHLTLLLAPNNILSLVVADCLMDLLLDTEEEMIESKCHLIQTSHEIPYASQK